MTPRLTGSGTLLKPPGSSEDNHSKKKKKRRQRRKGSLPTPVTSLFEDEVRVCVCASCMKMRNWSTTLNSPQPFSPCQAFGDGYLMQSYRQSPPTPTSARLPSLSRIRIPGSVPFLCVCCLCSCTHPSRHHAPTVFLPQTWPLRGCCRGSTAKIAHCELRQRSTSISLAALRP